MCMTRINGDDDEHDGIYVRNEGLRLQNIE